MAIPKKGEGWGLVGCSKEEQGKGAGKDWLGGRGGCKGFGCVVSNAYKNKKNGFFEGCPVRWGGYPSGLVTGLDSREGLAWRGKAGWVPTGAGLVDGGARARGGVQGLRFRGGKW